MRARRDRARNFNIQHHLAIRTIGIAGRRVVPMRNRYSRDFRCGTDAELLEIGRQVARLETAAEFDQRDRLIGAVSA